MCGVLYLTGEHAFHSSKFEFAAGQTTDERKEAILAHREIFKGHTLPTAKAAKCAGGKKKNVGFPLTPGELAGWELAALQVQRDINKSRLLVDPDLQRILLDTKDQTLLHQDNRAQNTTIWGGRVDPGADDGTIIGQNKLGILWMELRSELKRDQSLNSTNEIDHTTLSRSTLGGQKRSRLQVADSRGSEPSDVTKRRLIELVLGPESGSAQTT